VLYKGHAKWFNSRKCWGFVTGDDGRDYFVHQRDVLSGGWKVLREGEPVIFETVRKGSDQLGKDLLAFFEGGVINEGHLIDYFKTL